MKLPNGDRAVVDIDKIERYCLNTEHPRGRHKARVFNAALGLTNKDAELLADALLTAARTADAMGSRNDQYGQRFVIEFEVQGPFGPRRIRSAWIVRTGEDVPRFSSCYVV